MNKIKIKVTGTKGTLGKTQTANFIRDALLAFDPVGVEPVTIVIRDDENTWTLEPQDRREHTPVEALLNKVRKAGLPENIKDSVLECIVKSYANADGERDGFAEEMATQYGFAYLDDDAEILGVTRERLVAMMSVLGFRCGAEHRAKREKLQTEHDDFDKLLFAFGQAMVASSVYDKIHEMPEFEAVRLAHQKVKTALDSAKRDTAQAMAAGAINANYGKFGSPVSGARKGDEYAAAHNMLMKLAIAARATPVTKELAGMPEFKAASQAVYTLLDNLLKAQAHAANQKMILNSCWGKHGTPIYAYPVGGVLGSGENDHLVKVRKGYGGLLNILVEALNQAQKGKGAERHNLGGDLPFEKQRMQSISELVGSVDGMSYQACKKITEGVNLPTLDRQVAELLGAINYIAGMIVFLRNRTKSTDAYHLDGALGEYCVADIEAATDLAKWAKDEAARQDEAVRQYAQTDAAEAERILRGCQVNFPNIGEPYLSIVVTAKSNIRELAEKLGFDLESLREQVHAEAKAGNTDGPTAAAEPGDEPDMRPWNPSQNGKIPEDIHANTFVEIKFADATSGAVEHRTRACCVNWQLNPWWRVAL